MIVHFNKCQRSHRFSGYEHFAWEDIRNGSRFRRKVSGELISRQLPMENFDTAAVKAETEDGIPIYYDTNT